MAGTSFDPDAYLAEPPQAFDPDAYLQSLPEVVVTADREPANEMPAPRSFGQRFGATTAGLADTLFGVVPGAIAETGYAGVRAMEGLGLAKPGQAQRGKEAFLREYGTPFGSAFGVTQTPEYRGEASQQLMQFIGENVGKGADWISANTGVPKADVENMIFTAGFTLPAAYRGAKTTVQAAAPYVREAATAVAESAPGQAVLKPIQERNALIQEQNVARSFENAAQIDAAKLAVKYRLVIDPAVSNPTVMNRLKAGAVKSTNFAENAAKINDARFTQLAREDMGLPANTVLDSAAINKALSMHDAPYNVVAKLPRLVPDEKVLAQIEGMRIQRPGIGGETSAAAVNSLVDEAIAKVSAGRSGAEIIADIRKLRRDANNIYAAQQKSGLPDPALLAKAETNISIANALEGLIDANAPNPKVLADLRAARTAKAKIYDYERALNTQTNRIDPQVLAKMARDGKPLSGTAADIAKIASVFPDIAQTGQTGVPTWAKGLTRSGAAGTAGLTTAAVFGAPLIPGAVIGAGLGYVGGGLAARRMATPGYQAKYAVPQDFRSLEPVNKLAPEPRNNLRK
jgi:hypothetical protein